ncbi:MAG TPA: metal-dependent hydrolase [Desulfocapsa sulfexigens]|nr:metal-dependent hydrolase [Desulfocapsa sulfexigens]
MTGPTHIAIAVSCGIMAGAGRADLALLAGGAIIPDLDTPRSFIGRVFFPLSIPLNKWLGHRGPLHSFWLWGLVAIAGIWWKPAFIIGAGALLHIFADCATVSGVRGFAPWSEKLFVLFKRDWRIKTGSGAEIIILVVFGSFAWAGGYVGAVGGIRAMIGHLTGAPKIMVEEFRSKGLQQCRVHGKFRWNSGLIEQVDWLIIGTEGQGLAMQGIEKIVRTPKHGEFLKARLKPVKDVKWEVVKLKGWAKTGSKVYFLDGAKWHTAKAGEVVWGQILGHNISLENNL